VSIYGSLARAIVFPVGDYVRGIPITRQYRDLRRSQWQSRAELQDQQDQRLRRLIAHAYANVPYYRRVMDARKLSPHDFQTTSDLHKLPILTKTLARQQASNLRAQNIATSQLTRAQTGGSTGTPLKFLIDRGGRARAQAAFRRGLSWAGFHWGDPIASVSGGLLGTRAISWKTRLRRQLTGYQFIPAFELNRTSIHRVYDQLRRHQPGALIGYSSSLYTLARLCLEAGLTDLAIPLAFTTAEVLLPMHQRALVDAFQSRVYDYYGCGEINSIAYQCPLRSYHITEENVHVELLPLSDAEPGCRSTTVGRAVLTDLTNFAFPFIRYENGDVLERSDTPCACGRALTSLAHIRGRTHDFIVTSDGSLLAGEFFPHLFGFSVGVEHYQVVQEKLGEIKVRLVASKEMTAQREAWLVDKIRTYAGADMRIVVERLDEIPKTPAGKHRVTVSKLNYAELVSVGKRLQTQPEQAPADAATRPRRNATH
jgi:phenylacetate-CoA ligase